VQAAVRYGVFLSYSHADQAYARWLLQKLEGYRVPKRLVGTPGRHGSVPARPSPVFRDRGEVPAATGRPLLGRPARYPS
jgi:hypothetical protein